MVLGTLMLLSVVIGYITSVSAVAKNGMKDDGELQRTLRSVMTDPGDGADDTNGVEETGTMDAQRSSAAEVQQIGVRPASTSSTKPNTVANSVPEESGGPPLLPPHEPIAKVPTGVSPQPAGGSDGASPIEVKAVDASGTIGVSVRCENLEWKVGDEIPFTFTVSNQGDGWLSFIDWEPDRNDGWGVFRFEVF